MLLSQGMPPLVSNFDDLPDPGRIACIGLVNDRKWGDRLYVSAAAPKPITRPTAPPFNPLVLVKRSNSALSSGVRYFLDMAEKVKGKSGD